LHIRQIRLTIPVPFRALLIVFSEQLQCLATTGIVLNVTELELSNFEIIYDLALAELAEIRDLVSDVIGERASAF